MTQRRFGRCDAPITAVLYMELHCTHESVPRANARSRRSSNFQEAGIQGVETLLEAYRQIDEPDGVRQSAPSVSQHSIFTLNT